MILKASSLVLRCRRLIFLLLPGTWTAFVLPVLYVHGLDFVVLRLQRHILAVFHAYAVLFHLLRRYRLLLGVLIPVKGGDS